MAWNAGAGTAIDALSGRGVANGAFPMSPVWHSLVRGKQDGRIVAPKFGTSGLRGLVSELTDELCAAYAQAFLRVLANAPGLMVGRDLRESSPGIAAAVIRAARSSGVRVLDLGVLPTPALALAALSRGWPAIMVTGSHIPADRNGLKFYTSGGEINKAHETAILAALQPPVLKRVPEAAADIEAGAAESYLLRYTRFFGPAALAGMRVGVYEHSGVGRDLLSRAVEALGGVAVPFGRAHRFVPVDTEAVGTETRALLTDRARDLHLDAVVSADGDADRPLVADETGSVIAGDILGTLTSVILGADAVAVPVSANSMIERTGAFGRVLRTRIGSPYVIAGMDSLRAVSARPVGFEPNGGFLLGFNAERSGRRLAALATRDALLPILTVLAEARRKGGVRALLAALPARRTASDRLEDVPTERSAALIGRLSADAGQRSVFFAGLGAERVVDLTDGLRVTFADGIVTHLRPSGNAPELRLYTEADGEAGAAAALCDLETRVRRALSG
jgi:phosphomannomutase